MFKTTKSKVVAVIIFSVICIAVTALLILYKNIDINDENQDIEQQEEIETIDDGISGIKEKGTYNQNDLKIEQKRITQDKVEITYDQISGLVNKEIEEKINKDLEHEARTCYKKQITNLDEVVNVTVGIQCVSSFENTLSSVGMYYGKIDDDSEESYQEYFGLNYDLTTGNKIEFKDLFTTNAPMEDILRHSAYYSFVQELSEEGLDAFVVNDYKDIEDDILSIINDYKKGRITSFSFTPKVISIYYNGSQYIDINMEDYPEYIAIYNRYKTADSIFETDNIGLKNLYNLTERYASGANYINYQKSDNYLIDIAIDYSKDDKFAKQLVEQKIKDIETEIERLKKDSSNQPNNFYILNYDIRVYSYNDEQFGQLTQYNEMGNSYEMTVHDFEENIEPKIIENNKNSIEYYYVYDLSNELKIEPQETIEYYKPETGEKIVI